jgi:hypothetical protein
MICRWDTRSASLNVVSVHSFEKESFLNPVRMGFDQENVRIRPGLRLAPNGRCGLLPIGDDFFAILPFQNILKKKSSTQGKSIHTVSLNSTSQANSDSQTCGSYVVKYTDLYGDLLHVYDVQFLSHYAEPTLLILYESMSSHIVREDLYLRNQQAASSTGSGSAMQGVGPALGSGCTATTSGFGNKQARVLSLTLAGRTYALLGHLPSLPFELHSFYPTPPSRQRAGLTNSMTAALYHGVFHGTMELVWLDKRFYLYRMPLLTRVQNHVPGSTVLANWPPLGITLEGVRLAMTTTGCILSAPYCQGRLYRVTPEKGLEIIHQQQQSADSSLFRRPNQDSIAVDLCEVALYDTFQPVILDEDHHNEQQKETLPLLMLLVSHCGPEHLLVRVSKHWAGHSGGHLPPSNRQLEGKQERHLLSAPSPQDDEEDDLYGSSAKPKEVPNMASLYILTILAQLPTLRQHFPILARQDGQACISGLAFLYNTHNDGPHLREPYMNEQQRSQPAISGYTPSQSKGSSAATWQQNDSDDSGAKWSLKSSSFINALTHVTQVLRPRILSSSSLGDSCLGIWTLYTQSEASKWDVEKSTPDKGAASSIHTSNSIGGHSQRSKNEVTKRSLVDGYMFLAFENSTLVLGMHTNGGIRELESSTFFLEGRTLFVGLLGIADFVPNSREGESRKDDILLLSKSRNAENGMNKVIVQVHERGLRALSLDGTLMAVHEAGAANYDASFASKLDVNEDVMFDAVDWATFDVKHVETDGKKFLFILTTAGSLYCFHITAINMKEEAASPLPSAGSPLFSISFGVSLIHTDVSAFDVYPTLSCQGQPSLWVATRQGHIYQGSLDSFKDRDPPQSAKSKSYDENPVFNGLRNGLDSTGLQELSSHGDPKNKKKHQSPHLVASGWTDVAQLRASFGHIFVLTSRQGLFVLSLSGVPVSVPHVTLGATGLRHIDLGSTSVLLLLGPRPLFFFSAAESHPIEDNTKDAHRDRSDPDFTVLRADGPILDAASYLETKRRSSMPLVWRSCVKTRR